MKNNPFTVSSPEMLNAVEMRKLYVPLAENFEIDDPGHVFIHGHRGCGKSMMLRSLAPDCKIVELQKELTELPYVGVYATIKSTDLDIAEFDRIKNQYAGLVLAEHALSLFFASKVLQSLREHTADFLANDTAKGEFHAFLKEHVFNRLSQQNDGGGSEEEQRADPLLTAIRSIDAQYGELIDYFRQLSLSGKADEYKPFVGKVVGYREFLFPLCSGITQLSCMPNNVPLYIMLDDADNLNAVQTQVLNTWVSYRTGNKVSFKISTQLGYKHYRTTSNQRIESPHDFKEVNISTIYTGGASKGAYPKWVEDIVSKRLSEHGISADVKTFFPVSEAQEKEIQAIKEKYKSEWDTSGKGYRPTDDATRYARPDYIKSLMGTSKQGSKYLYAGFDQLVHISSGIVRYFLDDAASMFAEQMKLEQVAEGHEAGVPFIDPAIQDQVVRDSADALMIDNLDKLLEEAEFDLSGASTKDDFKQLKNLIQSLGGVFQSILLSERSERRVFSIALSDTPPDEITRILRLGVKHGYLYDGAIGSKDGQWRTRRYVMTRRLAPTFKLDPTGFAGYLFVTTDFLRSAIQNPVRAIREFKQSRLNTEADDVQLKLELYS